MSIHAAALRLCALGLMLLISACNIGPDNDGGWQDAATGNHHVSDIPDITDAED